MPRFFRRLPPTPAPHANDGERLSVRIAFDGEDDLITLCRELAIPLSPTPADAPPVGAPRSVESPWPILAHPRLLQPQHCTVVGERAYVSITANAIEVTLSSLVSPYEVDDETVARAERIERALVALAHRVETPAVRPKPERLANTAATPTEAHDAIATMELDDDDTGGEHTLAGLLAALACPDQRDENVGQEGWAPAHWTGPAEEASGRLAEFGEAAVAGVVDVLIHTPHLVCRRAAASALQRIGRDAPEAVPRLVEMLSSPDDLLAHRAAEALRACDHHGRSRSALGPALVSPDDETRRRALRALPPAVWETERGTLVADPMGQTLRVLENDGSIVRTFEPGTYSMEDELYRWEYAVADGALRKLTAVVQFGREPRTLDPETVLEGLRPLHGDAAQAWIDALTAALERADEQRD